ncbi:recombinase family protein [Rhodocytophaga aerolata]|uniref:Recombinase family protein n=1 Tax=Rhodocytophaga aerolata TaxID=455078 RepID=A0ABT8RGS4_9BACT|nr:recombinase family protein [Rhodocytophaga aerolata]MDO1451312.1 recombinase family protein [Rhodocytophaga aerolata]
MQQPTHKSFVAYYRVSTHKQGQSGLGLEAQKAAVGQFAGPKGILVREYTEVESGKNNNRHQLQAAIAFAKQSRHTLIIAKLDRLSRNAGFIFELRDSGVDFVCADMPDANTLTVGIFAVLAQHERELISSRTKAALQAKRGQGHKLGSPQNLTIHARNKGLLVRQINASENTANRQAMKIILSDRREGKTFQQITDELNELGYRTRRGYPYNRGTVKRLFDRAMRKTI